MKFNLDFKLIRELGNRKLIQPESGTRDLVVHNRKPVMMYVHSLVRILNNIISLEMELVI